MSNVNFYYVLRRKFNIWSVVFKLGYLYVEYKL